MKTIDLFDSVSPLCLKHKNVPAKVAQMMDVIEQRREWNVTIFKWDGNTAKLEQIEYPPYLRGTRTYAYIQKRRIEASNLKSLEYMLTLTEGHRDKCKFCAWKEFPKRWGAFKRTLRRLGIAEKYFVSIEPTKDLWPHYHALVSGRWLNYKELTSLTSLWGSRVRYEKLQKSKGYAMKYVTKSGQDSEFLALLSVLKLRMFYTSRDLIVSKAAVTSRGRSPNVRYYFGEP